MKDAGSTHYLQVNNEVQNIRKVEGVEIMTSPEAFDKYKWTRKYFNERPKEGYFIRVKKSREKRLTTCAFLTSKEAGQNMQNLLVLDKGVKAKTVGTCASGGKDLYGTHNSKGNIVLGENATLEYQHVHTWGINDNVDLEYNFHLGENAQLNYHYKSLFIPAKFSSSNNFFLKKGAYSNAEIATDCKNTEAEFNDKINLIGENSSGTVKLKIIGREKSNIRSYSNINADKKAKGHLDCQGLITKNSSNISLIPELNCNNKDSELTHEASVGKISEDTLHYLKTRGLSEDKAIDLITAGFLRH